LIPSLYFINSILHLHLNSKRKSRFYFPRGDDWRDWETGAIYRAGTWAEINVPIEKLAVFARIGAVIPTQPIIQHTGEMLNVPVTLNVIGGIEANKTEITTLFQDGGDGYGYRKNEWREISIEHRQGTLKLNRRGDFNGQKIRFIEASGISQKPREVRIDGKIADEIEFDKDRQRLRIEIGENAKEISLVR
jgi:alpha-glucosidase (family GH31 glycosyl hydrolase)